MQSALEQRMLALSRAFQHSRIFLTAVELNLFSTLGDASLSAKELAGRVGADPRAMEVLLNALVAMALLESEAGRFHNLGAVVQALREGRGSDYDAFRHAVRQWENWSRLTETVRTGRPTDEETSGDWKLLDALAMRQYARATAGTFVRTLDVAGARSLLDVGGGAGTFAITMVERHPDLRAVVFDANERALALAAEEIASKRLEGCVTLRHGDFLRDDLGSGYDLALVSSVMCLLGVEENRRLLARVHAALADGGRVAIRDAIHEPTRTGLPHAAIFGVHLLVSTKKGRAYSRTEVASWLAEAGFTDVRRFPLDEALVITARKLPVASR